MRKSKVLIIYTGGTIGMVQDSISGTLKPFSFSSIAEQIPELNKFNCIINAVSFKKPIDSSNMSPEHWVKMANIIEKNYSKYDGFVILHGSDTMAYSACALSFMFENLAKPIILTGSQLPVGEIRTDAKENLITAVEIAASKKNGKAIVPEVCIYFDYQLFRGNRAVKYANTKFEAFQSFNFPALAEAGVHITYNTDDILKVPKKQLVVHKKFCNEIAIIHFFPGITSDYISNILQNKRLKAVILQTFGAGNAPKMDWLAKEVKQAVKEGKIVFNVSQCEIGEITQGKYETSKWLKDAGVIAGKDITTEAAITKLMFLMAAGFTTAKVKKLIMSNLRGEISA